MEVQQTTGGLTAPAGSHDYPQAEEHISQILSEALLLDVERKSYRICGTVRTMKSSVTPSFIFRSPEKWKLISGGR
jgi:hypothetical protein